jgi:hypothetical protein
MRCSKKTGGDGNFAAEANFSQVVTESACKTSVMYKPIFLRNATVWGTKSVYRTSAVGYTGLAE